MSDPPAIVVKEKNPKRVAAGKKLAEKNKMYKEHFEKTSGATNAADEKHSNTASESAKSSNTSNTYYFIGVVVLVVSGIAYYYQSRPKSAPEVSRSTPEAPKPAPPKPDRTISM